MKYRTISGANYWTGSRVRCLPDVGRWCQQSVRRPCRVQPCGPAKHLRCAFRPAASTRMTLARIAVRSSFGRAQRDDRKRWCAGIVCHIIFTDKHIKTLNNANKLITAQLKRLIDYPTRPRTLIYDNNKKTAECFAHICVIRYLSFTGFIDTEFAPWLFAW